MNILAVDTSAMQLLVALKKENKIEEHFSQSEGMKCSEIIMPQIINTCESAALQLRDLNLIVCTRGPGSFTGLRVGMSVCKGLSLGLGVPLVSVSTLEYFASQIRNFEGAVVSALDARQNKFYLGVFECKEDSCKRISEDMDAQAAGLRPILAGYDNILVVGPDSNAFAALLQQEEPEKLITTDAQWRVSPGTALIETGLHYFEKNGADSLAQGPFYIRKSNAEITREEGENGNKV